MIFLAAPSGAQSSSKIFMAEISSKDGSFQTPVAQTLPKAQDTSRVTEVGFNFLGLPPELRVMVYEQLAAQKRHKLFQGQWREWDSTTRVDLIMPDPIPPIHLTCRLISNEAAPTFQRMVPLSRIPRIVFGGSLYTTCCLDDLTDLMDVISRLFCMREFPDAPDAPISQMTLLERSTSLSKEEIKTVQRFIDWTMGPLERSSRSTRQAHPIHVVHEDHWRLAEWGLFNNEFGWESCFEKGLPVMLYSLGEPVTEPYEGWDGFLKYGGKLEEKTWNAEWA